MLEFGLGGDRLTSRTPCLLASDGCSFVPMKNLLCVANFRPNTGFAWTFIEGLYAALADRLEPLGVRTWVAYPSDTEYPATLIGSVAEPLHLPTSLASLSSVLDLAQTIRSLEIGTLYLSDRRIWHPAYGALRLNGLRTLIVHDHTSGLRTKPGPIKGLLKEWRFRVGSFSADRVIAVSDFVYDRKVNVDRFPREKVTRIWNSVPIPISIPNAAEKASILSEMGLQPDRVTLGCASRASEEKGVPILLRAFDKVWRERKPGERPQLLFMGDGPFLKDIKRVREGLGAARDIHLPGYVKHAAKVLSAVSVAVVPSVWQEAFGLAALEPMSWGVPVIASDVGGLPEVVRDGESGLLVPAGDEEALAKAIVTLIDDEETAARMGRMGRERASTLFSRDAQVAQLEALFIEEMSRKGTLVSKG